MMSNCAVVNCKTSRRNAAVLTTGAEVSFHRFPIDPKLRVKWVNATGKFDWTPSKRSTICSLHFTDSCFVKSVKKCRLTKTAVPTIDIRENAIDYEGQELDSSADDGDVVMNPSTQEEPLLSPARFKRIDDYVNTDPDTESIIKTEGTDNFLSDTKPNDAMANVCVACLHPATSQRPVADRLRVTYRALCGDVTCIGNVTRTDDVTLCRLCRQLLQNAHRFREQCRSAAAVLARVETPQKVTDEFRQSINLHLNLTTVHNSADTIITIKHETHDVITKTTENSKKTTKNEKIEASKTTDTIETAQVGTFEGVKSEHMATPAGEDLWKPLWLEEPLSNYEADDMEIMSDDSDKTRIKSEKRAAKILKNEPKKKKITPVRILKRKLKLDAAPRRPKAKELNEEVMKTVTLKPHELMDFLNARKQSATYVKAVLKCDMCYKTFSTKQAHESHMYNHTSKRGDMTCDICKLRFKAKCRLRDHVMKHLHKYMCTKCNFQSQHITAAKQHINVHEEIKLKCEKCNTIYRHKSTYLTHIRIHHPSTSTICQLCGYSFINRHGLHAHTIKMHRVDVRQIPEDGPFCTMCDTRFVDDDAYQKHMKVTACSSNTRSPYNITKSMRWKGNCEKCGKELPSYSDYQRHFKTEHPDDKMGQIKIRYLCYVCGKKFQSAALLNDHILVHDPSAAAGGYTCDDCGKSYLTPMRLALHRRIHSGVRYACRKCGREFNAQNNRDRHEKFAHTDVKKVKCDFCDKMFKSNEYKKTHESFVHLNRPYKKRNWREERERRSRVERN